MQPWEWDWSAITAIIASCVALYAAYRANKIARIQLKTLSEIEIIKLREKWIDDVRDRMTTVISLATKEKGKNDQEDREYLNAITSLMLLLSHSEPETREFLDLITDVRKSAESGQDKKTPTEAVLLGKSILKKEWSRLLEDLETARNPDKL